MPTVGNSTPQSNIAFSVAGQKTTLGVSSEIAAVGIKPFYEEICTKYFFGESLFVQFGIGPHWLFLTLAERTAVGIKTVVGNPAQLGTLLSTLPSLGREEGLAPLIETATRERLGSVPFSSPSLQPVRTPLFTIRDNQGSKDRRAGNSFLGIKTRRSNVALLGKILIARDETNQQEVSYGPWQKKHHLDINKRPEEPRVTARPGQAECPKDRYNSADGSSKCIVFSPTTSGRTRQLPGPCPIYLWASKAPNDAIGLPTGKTLPDRRPLRRPLAGCGPACSPHYKSKALGVGNDRPHPAL